MRRLFIIRKDLHLSSGKLSAMIGHCCEAYWTNLLKAAPSIPCLCSQEEHREVSVSRDIWDGYVNGIFTKTICEAKNRAGIEKAAGMASELGLLEGVDFGMIRDLCLTELTPEDDDGRTLVGIWFRPLPDDVAHSISKKFKLYRDSATGPSDDANGGVR